MFQITISENVDVRTQTIHNRITIIRVYFQSIYKTPTINSLSLQAEYHQRKEFGNPCCVPCFSTHELVPSQKFVSRSYSHIINYGQLIFLGFHLHVGLMARFSSSFPVTFSPLWSVPSDGRAGLSLVKSLSLFVTLAVLHTTRLQLS
jgi:hypothetical protein